MCAYGILVEQQVVDAPRVEGGFEDNSEEACAA